MHSSSAPCRVRRPTQRTGVSQALAASVVSQLLAAGIAPAADAALSMESAFQPRAPLPPAGTPFGAVVAAEPVPAPARAPNSAAGGGWQPIWKREHPGVASGTTREPRRGATEGVARGTALVLAAHPRVTPGVTRRAGRQQQQTGSWQGGGDGAWKQGLWSRGFATGAAARPPPPRPRGRAATLTVDGRTTGQGQGARRSRTVRPEAARAPGGRVTLRRAWRRAVRRGSPARARAALEGSAGLRTSPVAQVVAARRVRPAKAPDAQQQSLQALVADAVAAAMRAAGHI